MPLALVPLSAERFPAWLKRCQAEYEADLLRAGADPETARQQAAAALEQAFPAGGPSEGNEVFDLVVDDGEKVGYLWVGPDSSGHGASWWVWDIVVDSQHRGRGHGRAAMLLAEDHARANGAATLGLNVFGFNDVARSLYESVGYETTSVKMRKVL